LLEEAYKIWWWRYRRMASSDSVLQAAVDEAKDLAKITKPINQPDVVAYGFLRAALEK